MARAQTNRRVGLTTTLGPEKLLLREMNGVEELGRLSRFDLDLVSEDANLDFDELLAQPMSVRVDLESGDTRHFHGLVSEFSQVGTVGRLANYRATLRPWFWLLTRTSDCKIFQEMKVPEIIKQVFRDHGFSDFEDRLSGTYRTWEYCVQYRETHFAFLSRLMEQEGIYYYIRHDEDAHTLVLADDPGAHENYPNYEELKFFPPDEDVVRNEEHVFAWALRREVRSGAYAMTDYDFKAPGKSLKTQSIVKRDHASADFELFDYPGEFTERKDGEDYTKRRIEQIHTEFEVASAKANARGLACGSIFGLLQHPRDDQNREYLIRKTLHTIKSDVFESGQGGSTVDNYSCEFVCQDAKTPFRSAPTTPRPVVAGAQTAVVVGKSGEEITTDEYGRVKLQFHWDRYSTSDEQSSCWVRVSQNWASKKWGAIFTPRIGDEVIVEFLEGDPDQPIITGRVYNADNMPPYALPDDKTQSGVKSRSTLNGSPANFNEIRFEDKKGSELVTIHAEKDESIVVENDKTESVGNNETISIGNDRTETVGHDETLTVANNRARTVGKNEDVTVAMLRSHTVGVNESITVGAAQEITIGATQALTIGATQDTNIGASKSETIGSDMTLSVGKDKAEAVGGESSVTVGKKLTITVEDEITLKTGDATLQMKKDGTITLKGKDIIIDAKGKISAKASKDVVIKGKKILEN